jgi:signal peptidase I
MYPAYQDKEYVLTTIIHNTGQIKRDDVIVYKNNATEQDFIKRVIALPGETVMIKDGSVFVNGTKLDEASYLTRGDETQVGRFLKEGQSVKVPANSYFVLGDNRPFSNDSRENGFVSQKDVIGKVSLCYWNCKQ